MLLWLNASRRKAAAALSGCLLFAALAGGGGPLPRASSSAAVPAAGEERAVSPHSIRNVAAEKTIYLTFDDGPSRVTPQVLDILQKQGVKATFFVLGEAAKRHPEWVNAIYEQGHALGNHSYDHNYSTLYSGFPAFWKEIKETEETLRLITGQRPRLVRAPGGTAGHFDDTYFYLMKQAGYLIADWTVDSGDSVRRGVPASEILSGALAGLGDRRVILLLHDGSGHEQSAQALPEIIRRYRAAGYEFRTMESEADTVRFKVHPSASYKERAKPSAAWIASHIVSNAELFAPEPPLVLEVGLMQTTLAPGEYRLKDGHYEVPLRAVVERFGGSVVWDTVSRTGRAVWSGRTLTADPAKGTLRVTGLAQEAREALLRQAESGNAASPGNGVGMRGDAIWVPLRTLLESTGHRLLEIGGEAGERRVKAA